jgi:hypothetical protein
MKFMVTLGVLSALVVGTSANAQLVPFKANLAQGNYVTYYKPCTSPPGGLTTAPPVALPACTPVIGDAGCGWGAKGQGKYKTGVKNSDVTVQAGLSGLGAGCEGKTLSALSDATVTSNDCVGGPTCTLSLSGFPLGLSCTVTLGKCSIKGSVEGGLGLGSNVFKAGKTYSIQLGSNYLQRSDNPSAPTFVSGLKIQSTL